MPFEAIYRYPPHWALNALVSHMGDRLTKETSNPRDIIVVTTKPLPKLELVFPSFVVTNFVIGVVVTTITIWVGEDTWVGFNT